MKFTPKEEGILWITVLLQHCDFDNEKIAKRIEVYRLEKFPTLTIQEINEILDTVAELIDNDISRMISSLRNGN